MSRILVTGGAGFIGSHTCLLLLEKGYDVLIIDSYKNSSELSIKRVKKILSNSGLDFEKKVFVRKCDMTNFNDLEKIFSEAHNEKKPLEGVIHFAGLKSVSESKLNPIIYWENNLISTINLLKIMQKYKCFSLIFSSSATIYDQAKDFQIKENDKLLPINPYGNTKFTIEKMLNDIFESNPNKWKIVCLRYFNPIGAHESGLIGENPIGMPNNIFPLITQIALGKISQLRIFGDNWPTKDGTPIRDYIHVMDLAEGHILALDYLFKTNTQILHLNIGTGKGTSVLELLKCFEKVNKIKIPYIFTERREGDNGIVVANNEKVIKVLKWRPKRTIEEMCQDGWKWQFNNPKGY